jgi:stearoyl-CoA desaturase (delta-9 desaturase)
VAPDLVADRAVHLVTTHITIAAVTIFLHRAQAHRALDLHAIPAHFFRFWLWMTTGMVTKEWVAIHRKHHAKCETVDDPHSPQTRGLKTVLWRAPSCTAPSPRTWKPWPSTATARRRLDRAQPVHRFQLAGRGLMLILDLACSAPCWRCCVGRADGLDPVTGGRHHQRHRPLLGLSQLRGADASTNVSPWGIVIGGEELHNNHHTYPTSAKFSVKPYEFDIGWAYIRLMQKMGWAKVKKTPPKLQLGDVKPVADEKTLEA